MTEPAVLLYVIGALWSLVQLLSGIVIGQLWFELRRMRDRFGRIEQEQAQMRGFLSGKGLLSSSKNGLIPVRE